MPFVPVGYAAVTHVISLTGDPQPMVATYHIGPIDADPVTYSDVLAASVHDAFGDEMLPFLGTSYSLISTELLVTVNLDPFDGVQFNATDIRAGTGNASTLPQNSAYLIHKRTSTAGRTGRGRLYLPGVPEGITGNTGVMNAADVTARQTNLNAWLARFGAGGLVDVAMYLAHSERSDGTPAAAPSRVTLLQLDNVIATQRRRLRP